METEENPVWIQLFSLRKIIIWVANSRDDRIMVGQMQIQTRGDNIFEGSPLHGLNKMDAILLYQR